MQVALKNVAESSVERRAFGRRETHLPGTVRIANRNYDCIVKDLSEGGALLEFEKPIKTSGWIRLTFEGYPDEILCEPRHEKGNRVGVQFARQIAVPQRSLAPVPAAAKPAPAPLTPITFEHQGSQLVAARRSALRPLAKQSQSIQGTADPVCLPSARPHDTAVPRDISSVIEFARAECAAVARAVPRDMSSLLASVAALIAERAVPRPLPAWRYVL